MTIDINALRAEIVTDPLSIGYSSAVVNGETGKVLELLLKPQWPVVRSRMTTARGIMAGYGLGPTVGAGFLDKLQALSPSVPAIKWAMKFLEQEAGLDIGEPATRAMLDSLVGIGGITQAEADGIKAMAMHPVSRAEVLGFTSLTEQHVIEAMNG